MTTALVHRGPDDHGHTFFSSHHGESTPNASAVSDLALGHRRLSILDLSERGRQPMSTPDGRLWVTYNGEIYNYVELRAELRELGHSFDTDTDTEVLLAAYVQWGRDCVKRFNGMWAFAIWDAQHRQLFASRDRFGIKPFYYVFLRDTFAFASEIKALTLLPEVPVEPNARAVHDYLALKLSDHTDETFYKHVYRLPAGHNLLLGRGGTPVLRRYWSVAPSESLDWRDDADATRRTARLGELLRDSVRLRLRSDVLLGTCLSGGLDSSSIVTLANQLMFDDDAVPLELRGAQQRTFSACFKDARFDESHFVDDVIAATGAKNDRTYPDARGFWDDLPKLMRHMDEPFHSTSQYAQYCVMQLVAQHGVKVTLDGQGADELLAGYPGYFAVAIASRLAAGQPVGALRQTLSVSRVGGRGASPMQLIPRVAFSAMPSGLASRARGTVAKFVPSVAPEGRSHQAISADLLKTYAKHRQALHHDRSRRSKNLGARLHDDTFKYSLPALLRYEDRNSMAHSIESRTPMLDYRFAEHCFSLPAEAKVHRGRTKWALRDAMRHDVPKSVLDRTDKMGFVTPELIWLRETKSHVLDILGGTLKSASFLEPKAVRAAAEASIAQTAETSYYTDVFRWLSLEMWMQHISNQSVAH